LIEKLVVCVAISSSHNNARQTLVSQPGNDVGHRDRFSNAGWKDCQVITIDVQAKTGVSTQPIGYGRICYGPDGFVVVRGVFNYGIGWITAIID
jgi:hypothetical protein